MTFRTLADPGGPLFWPGRVKSWLDARGRPAWIAAVILGLILAWPVGVLLLACMTWSRGMFLRKGTATRRTVRPFGNAASTGNSAFDADSSGTPNRLAEEQAAFAGFLKRLRDAKDKQAFDAFMEEGARNTAAAGAT